MTLENDPNWKKLQQGVVCSCGETHVGLVDLMIYWPEGWKGGRESIEPNRTLRLTGNFLSDDFCVMDDKYFAIRTNLSLPIKGGKAGEKMTIACWCAVLRPTFLEYAKAAPRGETPGTGKAACHLVSEIHGYPKTYSMRVDLEAPGNFLRPIVYPVEPGHPLVADQRDGITLDRAFELFAANGHDMRPGLKKKAGLFGQKK